MNSKQDLTLTVQPWITFFSLFNNIDKPNLVKEHRKVYVFSIDFKAAFNFIDKEAIFFKLANFGQSINFYES